MVLLLWMRASELSVLILRPRSSSVALHLMFWGTVLTALSREDSENFTLNLFVYLPKKIIRAARWGRLMMRTPWGYGRMVRNSPPRSPFPNLRAAAKNFLPPLCVMSANANKWKKPFVKARRAIGLWRRPRTT